MCSAFRNAQVWHDQDIVARDGLNQRARHFFVAHQMGESVDAGLDEVGGISSIVDVRDDRQVACVGLIDNRAIEFGFKFFDVSVPVVDPDLHNVNAPSGEFPHGVPSFLFGGDTVCRGAECCGTRACIRRRQTAAGGE